MFEVAVDGEPIDLGHRAQIGHLVRLVIGPWVAECAADLAGRGVHARLGERVAQHVQLVAGDVGHIVAAVVGVSAGEVAADHGRRQRSGPVGRWLGQGRGLCQQQGAGDQGDQDRQGVRWTLGETCHRST